MSLPFIFGVDKGFTVEKCKSAIGAASALTTFPGQGRYWESVVQWWEEQLKFAEKRENVDAS